MVWSDIARHELVDDDGVRTGFSIPTLEDTLAWAVDSGAILELDRKAPARFSGIVDAVRAAGAEENVILITYDDSEALLVSGLAPDLMLTAGIGGRDHEARMIEAGLNPDALIAWTGTDRPSPGKWQGLASKGIESAFGTLGTPGRRLDDQYWADGDPSEYVDLVEAGLTMLATDEAIRLAQAGGEIEAAQDRARNTCLQH